MSDISEFEKAFEAGRMAALTAAAPKVAVSGGVPYLVVPDGHTIELLNGDLLEAPLRRIIASPVFRAAGSFTEYLDRFRTPAGAATVFADQKATKIVAIIDYHEKAKPQHCDHRATLLLEHSANWKRWIAIDRKPQSQVVFAEFLEDAIGDILRPDGAGIMEAVTTLESHREVAFRSAINLSDGTRQFTFVEEGGAKGSVVVPKLLALALPIYEGDSEPTGITARLRYKITEDKLWFTVVLDNPAAAVTAAFGAVVEEIEEAVGTTVLLGTP